MDLRSCKKECAGCVSCDVCGAPAYSVNLLCGSCISCENPRYEMYEWH